MICSTSNPRCGLSSVEARRKYLTPYTQLQPILEEIKKASKYPMEVGPLIRNGKNGGLLNIDGPLSPTLPVINASVCGTDTNPTVRQAVVCTVQNDAVQPPRGNIDASKVGFSNQGRTIWAVRVGSGKLRTIVTTQIHGNEPASTEAVLSFLKSFKHRSRRTRKILSKLQLLFVIRANPDAGEPSGTADVPLRAPFTESSGFFRHNVDPQAGGGFKEDTENSFFGVVGRGYDMNRYFFVRLDGAIRPLETQAIVAALHAYRPHILFDMHGDVQKALCDIDENSVVPASVIGFLPSAKCKPPGKTIPTVLTDRERTVVGSLFAEDRASASNMLAGEGFILSDSERLIRKIATRAFQRIEPRIAGHLARFSQIIPEDPDFTAKSIGKAVVEIGVISSGWEVLNFATPVRAAVSSVSMVNGSIVPQLALDTYLTEPCFLRDNICMHELLLREMLGQTRNAMFADFKDEGFCKLPAIDGVIVSAPKSLGWGSASTDGDVLAPTNKKFGVSTIVSGTCPARP